MSIINGSLFGDVVKFHQPESHSSTAVIVIDEMNAKGASETVENCHVRKQSQQKTLRFCQELGCRVIVVHEFHESYPKHIYDIIDKPDLSCVKQSPGVLDAETEPHLLPFLTEKEITSLVLMGGKFSMCVRESLIGRCSYGVRNSGVLNHQITVLTSPSLLADYNPELYQLKPRFSPSASFFSNDEDDHVGNTQWPLFALHKGMRIYTRISD